MNVSTAIVYFGGFVRELRVETLNMHRYGWYWGPISDEATEKLLSNEPDGSFIVRDSCDLNYILELTFKLNGLKNIPIVRDQGNFHFFGSWIFQAETVAELIDHAVEVTHRFPDKIYLNPTPTLQPPMNVQLRHPVSRFSKVTSLQQMCRFAILRKIRRDQISKLPLPSRLKDFLIEKYFYSEHLVEI